MNDLQAIRRAIEEPVEAALAALTPPIPVFTDNRLYDEDDATIGVLPGAHVVRQDERAHHRRLRAPGAHPRFGGGGSVHTQGEWPWTGPAGGAEDLECADAAGSDTAGSRRSGGARWLDHWPVLHAAPGPPAPLHPPVAARLCTGAVIGLR